MGFSKSVWAVLPTQLLPPAWPSPLEEQASLLLLLPLVQLDLGSFMKSIRLSLVLEPGVVAHAHNPSI